MMLTQYSGRILGPIAKLLGYLMNGIYIFLDNVFHIQNIGLCIIVFTVIIYVAMLPLTFKQQKFAKLNKIMQPEIKKIQEKYKGRRDSASQQAMQEQTQAIYDKYGVSPMGSCIQMAIQIPILWSLYRVIYNVPAYVPRIKATFASLVASIMAVDGFQDKLTSLSESVSIRNLNVDFSVTDTTELGNYIIDLVYKLPTAGWDTFRELFSSLSGDITAMQESIMNYNYFLGLNISESSWSMIKLGGQTGTAWFIIGGILIPVISALTQLMNIRLTSANAAYDANDAMGRQMKMMNYFMPIFSFIMVFSLPIGVGIYWIAGACIRTLLQLLINRHLNKLDFDQIVEQNKEKAKAKAAKRKERRGVYENQIRSGASMKTKNIDTSKIDNAKNSNKNYKSGSMASKANMVKNYNNSQNKKKK
ncbi:YidC/Oxa1 family membrane protein insertase [Eubacterium oxidoreducens]|nr:YidC/Oxa1 family membrane protein insertase [Eubacterium oxidoreducens]